MSVGSASGVRSRMDPLALAVSLLLNLAFLLALRFGAMPHRSVRLTPTHAALQVRLIDSSPAQALSAPLESAPALLSEHGVPEHVASKRLHESRSTSVPVVPVEEQPAPTLRLFGDDGRVLIPQDASHAESFPAQRADHDAFVRANPVPYAPTRFERVWAPRDETLGEALVRETTVTHTWRTPWGTQVSCTAQLVLGVIGGCGWGFAPTAPIEELQRMRADPPLPRDTPSKRLLAQ